MNEISLLQAVPPPSAFEVLAGYHQEREWSEEAALANMATAGFASAMVALIYTYNVEWPPEEVKANLGTWAHNATRFFERFEIDAAPFGRLIAHLSAEEWDQESWDNDLVEIGQALLQVKTKLYGETDIRREHLKLIERIGGWCRNGGEGDLKAIYAQAPFLGGSVLKMTTRLHEGRIDHEIDHDDIANRMSALVQALTGERRPLLNSGDSERVKTSAANSTNVQEKWDEWKGLNKITRGQFDARLLSILQSASGTLPMVEVKMRLVEAGVKILYLADGFDGNIGLNDGKPAFFTRTGELLVCPFLTQDYKVTMNPAWEKDPTKAYCHFQRKGTPTVTGAWTKVVKQSRAEKRFEIVDNLRRNINAVRARWIGALLHPRGDRPLDQICALMMELSYELGSRIGKISGDNKGLSTLHVGDVRIAGNSFTLSYVGKAGVAQKHTYKSVGTLGPIIMSLMRRLVAGQKKTDWLFHLQGRRVTEKEVNAYMAAINKFGGTVHKLRHVRGTNLAEEIMANTPFKPSKAALDNPMKMQKEAEAWFKEKIGGPVGELLGHRNADGNVLPTTSIQNYIDPRFSHKFFIDHGVRVPGWVPPLPTAGGGGE